MINIKKEIYQLLKTLGYPVAQQSDNIFNEIPTITYYASNQAITVDLSGQAVSQPVGVVIDIWGNTSTEASRILNEVEELLREHGWRLTNATDVPNPDKTIYHISTAFERLYGVV